MMRSGDSLLLHNLILDTGIIRQLVDKVWKNKDLNTWVAVCRHWGRKNGISIYYISSHPSSTWLPDTASWPCLQQRTEESQECFPTSRCSTHHYAHFWPSRPPVLCCGDSHLQHACSSWTSGLQNPGKRTPNPSTPAITAAAWTTRAIFSGRRIERVSHTLLRLPGLTSSSVICPHSLFLTPPPSPSPLCFSPL